VRFPARQISPSVSAAASASSCFDWLGRFSSSPVRGSSSLSPGGAPFRAASRPSCFYCFPSRTPFDRTRLFLAQSLWTLTLVSFDLLGTIKMVMGPLAIPTLHASMVYQKFLFKLLPPVYII
jgi:hypothetical protein